MAGSINKVILVGNVGKDPDFRTFGNGNEVCNFSIATSDRWKDRNTGEQKERTEWHNISIHSPHLIKVVRDWVKKGTKLYVEGKLETRKWQDQSGQDRYTTEIALRPYSSELHILDGRNSDQPQQGQQTTQSDIEIANDEIPF